MIKIICSILIWLTISKLLAYLPASIDPTNMAISLILLLAIYSVIK